MIASVNDNDPFTQVNHAIVVKQPKKAGIVGGIGVIYLIRLLPKSPPQCRCCWSFTAFKPSEDIFFRPLTVP
ncbi:MAG: hypothetical protein DRH17_04875 [Deltaproteobacteria bacterium]|nr:MAG: hypothetical protein DRH17_04875 [Deltaproteobacteria bacterium]